MSKLDDAGRLLVRLGNNSKGELCIQIVMNIPLIELVKENLSE